MGSTVSGGGFGESGSSSSGTGSGSYGFGAAALASATISSSTAPKAAGAAEEVSKDTAATAASGGTHLAVKAVKKSLEAAKKVAESVKRKMEPKDYEAQNQRMGYSQPMEQNANGTSDRRTQRMVNAAKPLIAAASIPLAMITTAAMTIVATTFFFLAPFLGVASTETIYPESEAMTEGDYALIKAEMELYQGMPYVWAGDRPETSFDCSGLTAWVYGRALGISLPHSAQGQYDMSTPVAPEDAKPGDLVFFHSTYETDKYITHVGIYAGEGVMFEAGGGGVKYTDLNTDYWAKHFAGVGRVNGTSDQIVSR